jgi:hypothetical protein
LSSSALGGVGNVASGPYSTIGGGNLNEASGDYSAVGGGILNTASGDDATIGGGYDNTASGASTIGGGGENTADGGRSTIGGGLLNDASGEFSVVGGGFHNEAIGEASTIPGGYNNEASGDYSFAAGFQAVAAHTGAFVWSDSSLGAFTSSGPDQFLIDANGGVGIGTNNPQAQLHIQGNCIGCMTFYSLTKPTDQLVTGTNTFSCDPGDMIISGGGWVPGTTAWLRESWAIDLTTWKIHFTDVNGNGVKPGAFRITCADLDPN